MIHMASVLLPIQLLECSVSKTVVAYSFHPSHYFGGQNTRTAPLYLASKIYVMYYFAPNKIAQQKHAQCCSARAKLPNCAC